MFLKPGRSVVIQKVYILFLSILVKVSFKIMGRTNVLRNWYNRTPYCICFGVPSRTNTRKLSFFFLPPGKKKRKKIPQVGSLILDMFLCCEMKVCHFISIPTLNVSAHTWHWWLRSLGCIRNTHHLLLHLLVRSQACSTCFSFMLFTYMFLELLKR